MKYNAVTVTQLNKYLKDKYLQILTDIKNSKIETKVNVINDSSLQIDKYIEEKIGKLDIQIVVKN